MRIEFPGLPNPDYASILAAAIDAVDPAAAGKTALQVDGAILTVGDIAFDLGATRRVIVLGAGKAAAPMAEAVEWALRDARKRSDYANRLSGLVVTKYGHGAKTDRSMAPARVRVEEAAHPVPDASGLAAGEEILSLAESATEDDLVIVVLSGGGSALLEVLPKGITLDDLQITTSLFLASGATITELNTVRKHLSRIKGGQLARAIAPARMVTLVLSDVVGSPLDAIASGPTVPDSTTWGDAARILDRYALWDRLPSTVAAHLRKGVDGALPDTPKQGDPCFDGSVVKIVADNRVAALAARAKAIQLGYDAEIVTNALEGEASEVARQVVADAILVQNGASARLTSPLPSPEEREKIDVPSQPDALTDRRTKLLIYGGETTVTLGEKPGTGGRNQELALTAALALEGTKGVTLISLATDGTDGPTDAAGGWADGETAARARSLGLDPEGALERHDAYPLLKATGALLETGPTRTNVNDLVLVFVS